ENKFTLRNVRLRVSAELLGEFFEECPSVVGVECVFLEEIEDLAAVSDVLGITKRELAGVDLDGDQAIVVEGETVQGTARNLNRGMGGNHPDVHRVQVGQRTDAVHLRCHHRRAAQRKTQRSLGQDKLEPGCLFVEDLLPFEAASQ